MAASPKSISNRNQNMFHNEMMLEKSWSSEDEDDVLARKVADLKEIIRARRSKKYGGIKEMYHLNFHFCYYFSTLFDWYSHRLISDHLDL
jgi:hypothetical protein